MLLNKNKKLFSIIIATYNCGEKVEKTIKSILAQNRDLFELIILDGDSTDDTLSYIKKYENDLIFVSEKDKGVYEALNKGIEMATGKYLYFIGAGDILRPNVLETVSEFLPQNNIALVYGQVYFASKNIYQVNKYTAESLGTTTICHQSIFYHHSIFDLMGKYDLKYSIYADHVLNWKCFAKKNIKKLYVPYIIADYEGGGLSEFLEDPNFKKDFPMLLKSILGTRHYLAHTFALKMPYLYWKVYLPFLRAFIHKEVKTSTK